MSQKVIAELQKIREEMSRRFGKSTRTVILTIDQLLAIQIILKHVRENDMKPDSPATEFDLALEGALAQVSIAVSRVE